METIADHFKGWNALETIHTGETWNGWRSVKLTWGTFFTPGFKAHHLCLCHLSITAGTKLTRDQF